MPRYWINLFTPTTWEESRAREFKVTGHRATSASRAHAVEIGDFFVCYVTKSSVVPGLQRVVRGPYTVEDTPEDRVWEEELYPVRFDVELTTRVPLASGVPRADLLRQGSEWTWLHRRSLNEVPPAHGDWIRRRLEQTEPKLSPSQPEPGGPHRRRPPVPEGPNGGDSGEGPDGPDAVELPRRRDTRHSEMQFRLAKLGRDMGLKVWIARNDRNVLFDDQRLGDLSEDRLPGTLPEEARHRIELIDVLWLRHDSYVAAFEVEATTPPLMDLARMGDLIALMPNLTVPMFIVAPTARRGKVMDELSRPLFKRGHAPLAAHCRYIAFEELADVLDRIGSFGTALDPHSFLDRIAEEVP